MTGATFSIRLGNFLFRNAFPVYNRIYPFFKRRQDAEEIALLKRMIKPGDVVVDIGANIGFYTKILSSLVGEKGRILAFEPDSINFKHLEKNTAHLKNVTRINKAVSDKTGPIKIYTSKLLNVDHRTYSVDEYEDCIEIEAVSLDDYAKDLKINVIKMDIQGAEPFALKGMKQVCATNPEMIILTELWPWGLKQAGFEEQDVKKIVDEMQMSIYSLTSKGILPYQKPAHSEMGPEKYENIVITKLKIN